MDQYEGSYVVRTLSLFLTVSSFLRTPPSFSNDSTLSFVFAYLTLTSETPFCLSSSPFLFLFFFAFIFWPLLFLFPFPLRYFSRSFSLSFFLSLFLSLSLSLSYSLTLWHRELGMHEDEGGDVVEDHIRFSSIFYHLRFCRRGASRRALPVTVSRGCRWTRLKKNVLRLENSREEKGTIQQDGFSFD